jgi:hypothetical protein
VEWKGGDRAPGPRVSPLPVQIVRQIAGKGGYRVLLGARDEAKGAAALEDLRASGVSSGVDVVLCDITSPAG